MTVPYIFVSPARHGRHIGIILSVCIGVGVTLRIRSITFDWRHWFYSNFAELYVTITVLGIHVTKWLRVGTWSLLLFLATHKVGFYSYKMEFVQIKRRVRGKSSSLCWCKCYWSGLILENIRKMFLLSIWATGTMNMSFDDKHSLNVLDNQTRLQNSAYTTGKSLNFRVLCA